MFSLGISSGCMSLHMDCICTENALLLRRMGVAALELGYEHAGPALADETGPAALGKSVAESGLSVYSLHVPYRPERDLSVLDERSRIRAVALAAAAFELGAALGAGLMVVHGSQEPIGAAERGLRVEQTRRSLAELLPVAQRLGLRVALETMPPEWIPAGISEAWATIRDLDPDIIGFCLDTNHANLTADLVEMIQAFGPRLWHVHLSDNDGCRQRHWMPFEGVIDWPAVVAALTAVGYDGPLVYELDPSPDGPEEMVRAIGANFARLQKLVAEG